MRIVKIILWGLCVAAFVASVSLGVHTLIVEIVKYLDRYVDKTF